jgi:hypothetical protein
MRELIVKEPTTFHSKGSVHIYDLKKRLFYWHENNEKSISFNLPKGKFYSEGVIYNTFKFIPYPLIPLGVLDYSVIPKNFLIEAKNNINKATIYPGENFFYSKIDHKIVNHEFSPVLPFVIGHELHHYFFNDRTVNAEKQCDKGSYNMLMQSGYNPRQVYAAQKLLFAQNPDRCGCITKAIEQNKLRRF